MVEAIRNIRCEAVDLVLGLHCGQHLQGLAETLAEENMVHISHTRHSDGQ